VFVSVFLRFALCRCCYWFFFGRTEKKELDLFAKINDVFCVLDNAVTMTSRMLYFCTKHWLYSCIFITSPLSFLFWLASVGFGLDGIEFLRPCYGSLIKCIYHAFGFQCFKRNSAMEKRIARIFVHDRQK
jgi:hypothetical protein